MIKGLAKGVVSFAIAGSTVGAASAGCLARPVTSQAPTTKDSVTANLRAAPIDKVDLLFDIDNSASMGDKQAYLAVAIPDLVNRLITPNCVDASGNAVQVNGAIETSDANGVCPDGTSKPEFKPVTDMHIAVVTSSLGARGVPDVTDGSYIAVCTTGQNSNNDNRGELYDVGKAAGGPVADAPSGFLAWFPANAKSNDGKTPPAKPIADGAALALDFSDVVTGVGQDGCGIESQLESWYRFLVQPDPYDSITLQGDKAQWEGVDTTILKERHDFLRPDSLVAIIDLTDENDSEIDVRANQQSGWRFLDEKFQPPKGTAACDNDPSSDACNSCQFVPNDPGCSGDNVHHADNDWGYDINLRHVHAKAKYGVDPQFPIDRYFKGLTQTKVPDRNGEYPSGAGGYKGDPNCTNPLFASALPDGSDTSGSALCNLPAGDRTPDLVFYGIIGGVPNQLLHYDPTSAASLTLSNDDWTKILGKDPEKYDYAGIDPHMVESYKPRDGIQPNDPVSGSDWVTDTPGVSIPDHGVMPFAVDREYACIFQIVDPKTGQPSPRDCTKDENKDACDCPATSTGVPAANAIPPVCSKSNVTEQDYAKVYPTPRELLLAKKMSQQANGSLNQGIVASLCPIDVTEKSPGDPLYGYRPAVAAIVSRLKNALGGECLPEALDVSADDGTVPCLVIAALPPGSTCDPALGLSPADPKSTASYLSELESESGDAGAGASYVICQVNELTPQKNPGDFDSTGSCSDGADPGWCYVTGNAAGGGCAQAVKFSSKGIKGGRVRLQCIQQSSSIDGG